MPEKLLPARLLVGINHARTITWRCRSGLPATAIYQFREVNWPFCERTRQGYCVSSRTAAARFRGNSRQSCSSYVLVGKGALLRFKLRNRHHIDSVPRAALEKGAVGAFAGAQFAADAQQRIDDNPAKRRVVRVRAPEHAIFHRAILDARRRTRAARAILIDHRENVRLALALIGLAAGPRGVLDHLAADVLLNARACVCHSAPFPRCGASISHFTERIRDGQSRCVPAPQNPNGCLAGCRSFQARKPL